MITVHMIGLMYFFNEGGGERLVLLPNGTGANNGTPPHHASFFIEPDDLESDDWWTNFKRERVFELRESLLRRREARVWEFRIPSKATVTIAGSDQNGLPLVTTNLDTALPKLRAIDPDLIIDPERADTIAEMPLRRGTAGVFAYGSAGAVQLDLDASGGREITVRLDDGEQRSIVLKPSEENGAREIVFCNTYDLLNGHHHAPALHRGHGGIARMSLQADQDAHFKLYGKLDAFRRDARLTAPGPLSLPQLPHDHDFLHRILQVPEVPGTGCVPTCC